MESITQNKDSDAAVELFLCNLRRHSGRVDEHMVTLSDWIASTDQAAINLQRRLDATKDVALCITLVAIVCLAALAVLMRTPAPQVLCPFVVFLMLLFNDKQRKADAVFHFASLRLAAETLRTIAAVRRKPDQLAMVLSARNLSTHGVVTLSAQACEACKGVFGADSANTVAVAAQEDWSDWVKGQGKYYEQAAVREKRRGQRARKVFNSAFFFVGCAGVVAGFWSYFNPAAMATDGFRILMAAASATGSCGLAYMSHVRDKKAFDQSFDYVHMSEVFDSKASKADSVLVNESINEHIRWALRMAGHMQSPVANNQILSA